MTAHRYVSDMRHSFVVYIITNPWSNMNAIIKVQWAIASLRTPKQASRQRSLAHPTYEHDSTQTIRVARVEKGRNTTHKDNIGHPFNATDNAQRCVELDDINWGQQDEWRQFDLNSAIVLQYIINNIVVSNSTLIRTRTHQRIISYQFLRMQIGRRSRQGWVKLSFAGVTTKCRPSISIIRMCLRSLIM